MLRPRYFDFLFYCSHYVDEIWIRSTILELQSEDSLNILLVFEGCIPEEIVCIYQGKNVKIVSEKKHRLKSYRADIFVTASTGIKREHFSAKIRHFCHMPHSLISLHAGYPEDAFDAFDVLFASAPHHKREFQKLRQVRGKVATAIFESGYGKLDVLLEEKKGLKAREAHVMIAPSWGASNIIETYIALDVIVDLLRKDYSVTLRPHPALVLYQKEKLEPYFRLTSSNFSLETGVSSRAIFTASLLITDHSGISFEYDLVELRPIVFVNSQIKIFNPHYLKYGEEPFEKITREARGKVVPPFSCSIVNAVTESISFMPNDKKNIAVYNPGMCGKIASQQLRSLRGC